MNKKSTSTQKRKKIIIVGAGEAGIMVLNELRKSPHMQCDVIGFIDDDPRKSGSSIHSIKILGGRDTINESVKKYNVEQVIISIPSADGKTIRDIVSKCKKTDADIKIVPGIQQIISGEVSLKQIRDVYPEDLLGREVVQISTHDVKGFINDKVVLITGASGSIGSELCQQIASFNPKCIILFDHNENDLYFLELELAAQFPDLLFTTIIGDIGDIALLDHTFSSYKPHIVFHAAAFKHVPLMEKSPCAAVKNNVLSTRNLINISEHYGVDSFVFISSDKAVNPTSIMGATKRIGEMILQAKAKVSNTKFMAVRFGNVLGSKGSVVPIFKKQIEAGGPVTVTHPDVRRYFMSTKEAVQLVLQASALGNGGEIFILDMGEQIKIIDLARDLIALSGFEPEKDIAIEFIGLRPGEKLFEEMLHNVEKDKATKHDRIYSAQSNDVDAQKLRLQIKELEQLVVVMDNKKTLSKIRTIVPSYNPHKEE